jgi:tetratricopeptide (TPR) repeat protein
MNSKGWVASLSLSILATVSLENLSAEYHREPFPPLAVTLSSPLTQLSDLAGLSLGFRRLTADMAWIQALAYYGTPEEGIDQEKMEHGGGGRYFDFSDYCQRVIHLDPYFKYVYYFGGGVLGWNLNRIPEAEKLLEEGIKTYPKEWRFQQYLAALAYQKSHDINKLVSFLEAFIYEEDCPNLLRSILANLYKKEKRYKDALRVWDLIFQTQDPSYLGRSAHQIQLLLPLAE